jgi:DNA-binding MarR family transcriptional regulator
MERPTDLAAAVDAAVDSLVAVLDAATSAPATAVPPTQLRVLGIVNANPGTNVNRLADALNVVPSSASRLCDRLEATGLLRRVADDRDRREVQLLLTPAAKTLLQDLRHRRQDALAAVLDRMSPATGQELLRSLTAFRAAAESPTHLETQTNRTA